nr:transglutaminase domain-containing protein [Hymenobacter psoromatis]
MFLFILIASSVYATEPVDSVRYAYAKKAPKTLELEVLVNYLKKGTKDNKKIVETFFYWIALNIQYDVKLRDKVGLTMEDVSLDSVLLKKKTICSGYSALFQKMCILSNIECEIINGIGQNYLIKQTYKTNHAWNAVKIDDKWHLIDTTWGSGGIDSSTNSYKSALDMSYFFTAATSSIIDHFPEDKQWQLLDNTISLNQFHSKTWNAKRLVKLNYQLNGGKN